MVVVALLSVDIVESVDLVFVDLVVNCTFNIVKPVLNYEVILWPKPKKEHLRKIGNLRVNLR